ncbi:MAG: hypothetical protein ACRDID_01225, partial [Ktedonobacterales bacterium]
AGAGERSLAQEAQNAMRSISSGGQPDQLVCCVAQALVNPYSDPAQMNQAMGYVPRSAPGSHYLHTAILTGLLAETRLGWLRPTAAGRTLAADAAAGHGVWDGVWDALLTLPAYRRYLEYKILLLVERNRSRTASEVEQIETAAWKAFPAFERRTAVIREMLALDTLPSGHAVTNLRDAPTLEPIGREALRHWQDAQGLGRQRKAISRAGEIAQTLAHAARLPLGVSSEWLEPAQLLALLLLVAARQRGQGIALAGASARGTLARAVERLRMCGIDIRVEQRAQGSVATLIPAVALRLASVAAVDALLGVGAAELADLARVVVATVRAGAHVGLDGEERGETAPAELANRCAEVASAGVGEFVGAAAADELLPVASSITLGGPLPLASDLPKLGRSYRFLTEATQGRGKHGWRGGVAALL